MPNRDRQRKPAGPTPLSEQSAIVRAWLPDFGDKSALGGAETEFAELDESAQRFTLASQNAILIDLGREQLRALRTVVNAVDETNELLAELVGLGGGGGPADDEVPQPDAGDGVEADDKAAEHVEAELLVDGQPVVKE